MKLLALAFVSAFTLLVLIAPSRVVVDLHLPGAVLQTLVSQ